MGSQWGTESLIDFLLIQGSERRGTRSSNNLRVIRRNEVLNFAVFRWRRDETGPSLLFWT